MTVTTTVGDLDRTLRLAACFADDPDSSPYAALSAVYLEAGGGILTATATDRYKVGHARTTATGDLPTKGALINVERVQWICDGLRDTPAGVPVHLGVDVSTGGILADRLTIATDRLSITVPTVGKLDWPGSQPTRNGWIDYPQLFEPFNNAAPDTGKPVLLDPRIVGVLAKVGEVVPISCSRWTVIDPLKPIRVEVDNVLTILLMPIREYRYAAEHWPIPVGLPARDLTTAGSAA